MSVFSPGRCALALAIVQALSVAHANTNTDSDAEIVRLDRLTVIGSAEQAERTSGSAHYIGPEALEVFNHRDINRILREVPGVYLVEEDGYGLFPNIGIRGSGTDRNNRITVMEDGVLIAPAPYAAPAAYHFPTAARINAIEVRKGSASVKAGPRNTGGAINLVSTPIPDTTAGQAEVAIGSDATLLSHGWVGTSAERGGFVVEGVRQQTDGFKELDGGRGTDTGYRLNDFMFKARLNSDANAVRYQSLELKFARNTRDADETYLGLTDEDFRANPQRRYAASARDNIQTRHQQLSLRHGIELSDRVDLTTVAYRTEFDRNWYKLNDVQGIGISAVLANPALYEQQLAWLRGTADSPDNALRLRNNNRAYYAQGVQSVLGVRLDGGAVTHDIEVGLRHHRDEEDRFQGDDGYRIQDGRMVRTSSNPLGTQDNRVGEARAWSLYVQDEIGFGRWLVTPGVRYERIELTRTDYLRTPDGRRQAPTRVVEDTVTQLVPGLGATFLATDDLTAFASVHRGFNPPGPGSGSNVEESTNYEAGLRYARNGFRSDMVGFWNAYSNLVGTCTASSGGNCDIGDQFDGGRARVRGIEASAGYDFGNANVTVPFSVNYTYTRAEFLSSFSSSFGEWGDVEAGDRLPYLPEHLFGARIGVGNDTWRVDLGGNYVDAMRTTASQGSVAATARTDAAVIFDLSASWRFASGAEVFAKIENLTDDTYVASRRPSGVRPGAPRTGLVGLRYAF